MAVLIALLALVAGLVVAAYAGHWAIFRRPLPRVDGALRVEGARGEIEILRDRSGVPHVRAESWEDLMFAVGFLHGQDRLWQMELHRRIAAGRVSEMIGPRGLPADRLMRRLGLRRVSEAEWHVTHAAGELRQSLLAYTAGVNAAIADRPLPAELTILRHRPEPWDPVDTLAVGRLLAFTQAGNWEAQLIRMRLLKAVGPEVAADLDPACHPHAPSILGSGGPGPDAAAGVLDEMRAVRDLLPLSGWSAEPVDHGAAALSGGGSNTWAVHGSRTASGAPLLANDPHSALTMPSAWYQVHLETSDEEVAGLTVCGAPFVLLGRNRRIAWGLANAQVSCQDLYVERFNPNNPVQFQDRDGWEDGVRFRETIRVRGEASVTEDVTVTRRGPVISPALPGNHPPLSLRWVALDSEIDSMSWVMRLNRARDWKGFRFAIGSCASPPLSVSYADVEGNIGYRMSGFIPLRHGSRGHLPAAGWEEGGEWLGFVPFEEMPEVFNPPEGFVVAANNEVVGVGYPHRLVAESSSPARARRIREVLAADDHVDVDACVALQGDLLSLPAVRLRRLLLERIPAVPATAAPPPLPREEDGGMDGRSAGAAIATAVAVLTEWDGRMGAGSAGGAIYAAILEALQRLMLDGLLSEALRAQLLGASVHEVFAAGPFIGRTRARLLEVLEGGRPGPGAAVDLDARDRVLRRAVEDACDELSREQGPDASRWTLGRRQRIGFAHPLAAAMPVLRPLFDRGPHPIGGDSDTPHQVGAAREGSGAAIIARTWAPFYRAVYDMSEGGGLVAINATGQSGHPASPHYADQEQDWLAVRPRVQAFGPGYRERLGPVSRLLLAPAAKPL
jgi:penicillin amidase